VTTARRVHHTYEDYLAALEMSDMKLEYCDGEIYAMAGGTPTHADLAAAATGLLVNALRGQGRVSSSDLKIRIEATDLSAFPDVTVVCGECRVSSHDKNAVTNPTLLVEVTSHSTEDYDRRRALPHGGLESRRQMRRRSRSLPRAGASSVYGARTRHRFGNPSRVLQ
jgi:Uma2 family endonuclease